MNRIYRLFTIACLPAAFSTSAIAGQSFSDELTAPMRGPDWSPVTALTLVADNIIPIGKTFISPNKKLSVQIAKFDDDIDFSIKDEQTEDLTRVPIEGWPVFSISWSPDSKSIVAVVHLSMTSQIELIHWNGQEWKTSTPEPPEQLQATRFHVVGWKFHDDYLETTYIINCITDHTSLHLYQITFNTNLNTNQVSDVKKSPITLKKYRSLRTARN
ncbi:MAG: hypothetical protein ABI443_12200 [Chthoniobacterales bacterium]